MSLEQEKLYETMKKIAEKNSAHCAPFSERAIDQIYEKAYYFYKNGNIPQAIRLFQTLVFHRPLEPIYWEGLASSLFVHKEYKLSLKAWAMVVIFAPENSRAHLYAAECYFTLDQKKEGLKALKEAKKGLLKETATLSRIELLEEIWGGKDG